MVLTCLRRRYQVTTVLYVVMSQATAIEFNVFAKEVAVCLAITTILNIVLVLVINVAKSECENTQYILSQS